MYKKLFNPLIYLFLLLLISGCEKDESRYLELDKTVLVFSSERENQTIEILTNGTWTAFVDADWLTISPRSGNGNTTVTVTSLVNNSFRERQCTIIIGYGMGWERETVTVEITQRGKTPRGVLINGVDWATHNLASHGTFVENPEDFGGLFQWGRRGDGHEQRNSRITLTRSTSNIPGHGNFIIHTASPFDWRNPQSGNLWSTSKTENDPCPVGWRVPTSDELESLLDSGSIWTTVNGINGRLSEFPIQFSCPQRIRAIEMAYSSFQI